MLEYTRVTNKVILFLYIYFMNIKNMKIFRRTKENIFFFFILQPVGLEKFLLQH